MGAKGGGFFPEFGGQRPGLLPSTSSNVLPPVWKERVCPASAANSVYRFVCFNRSANWADRSLSGLEYAA
ncbi:MAG: hypothetical protein JWO80_4829 [Bryobacterales bacterium]|nr:hypothetical protein [Bryobacterales bacterium]